MSDGDAYERVFEAQKRFVLPTYSAELLLVRGEGAYVWDQRGRRYLDCSTGISVCNLGHCHPRVTRAIREQAGKLVHVSNIYLNQWQPILAEKLVQLAFDGKVFFANSGAEANEGMIKFARKWGNPRGRNMIVTMDASFHGRTLATLAATGRSKYRQGFEPETPGFRQVPFNNIEAAAAAVDDRVAAVFLEPVQGEGGIIPADPAYLKALRALCDARGALLCFDEVQSGFGRTGRFFAYQRYGVEPDAMSMAKAIANGFPMGAFLVRRAYADTLGAGSHASTFGGTPLACAAALAVLEAFEEERVLENMEKTGPLAWELLSDLTRKHPMAKAVRGMGLMLGLVLDREAKGLLPIAREKGLLVLTAGENAVRFYPPLNVTEAELREAVGLLDAALKTFGEGQTS